MNAPDRIEAHPHYTERLRAEFDPLPAPMGEAQRAQLEHEAALLLGSMLVIDDSIGMRNASAADEEKEASADLLRLERKLDLVLELLAMRLGEGHALAERAVQLSAAGARWAIEGAGPAPGTQGIATIHVHRLLPRPLRLPVEVHEDQPGWLALSFLPLGESCEDLLVRHVFQQHRRQLAGSRRALRAA